MHALEPGGLYVPGAHATQLPEAEEYVPPGQGEHAEAPSEDVLPMAQGLQAPEEFEPTLGLKVFGGHGVQACRLPVEYDPALQGKQDEGGFEYVPGGQVVNEYRQEAEPLAL